MALAIRDEVIEELLQGYSSPQDLLGEEGLFKELKRRLLERALGAELTEHLGYERGDPAGRGSGNSRNSYSNKTVIGDDGAIEVAVPRDRNSSFEPQIVAKGQTRLDGFDEQTEGAKFWLKVMNELKNRGLNDVLIAVVDGLKGFPEAIGTVFPLTTVQTCIVHLIRNSLAFVSWSVRQGLRQPPLPGGTKPFFSKTAASRARVSGDRGTGCRRDWS